MTGTSTVCRACGKPLPEVRRPNRVYCDADCQRTDLKRKWAAQNPKSPLGAFSAGTIAEANAQRVAIDLLTRGYGVYRAAFPAMPYDIIIVPVHGVHPGHWQRVKVASGSRTPKGTIVHPKVRVTDMDVLAVVLATGEIVYRPEL